MNRIWRARLAYGLVFAVAVVLGRMTRPDGGQLALLWPAAAVGHLWMVRACKGRRPLVVNLLLMSAVNAALLSATGAVPLTAALFTAGSALQAVLGAALAVRAGRTPQLHRPADLLRLAWVTVASGCAGTLVGPVLLGALTHDPGMATRSALAWFVRNTLSAFLLVAVVLRLRLRSTLRGRNTLTDLGHTVVAVAVLASYLLVFWVQTGLPLAYVVIPLCVLVGLRMRTTEAAAQVAVIAVLVVAATWRGHGPFGHEPLESRILLAQSFLWIVAFLTLVVALHRDERDRLIAQLSAAGAEAADQAALLNAVFSSTTDAVAVFGADRAPLLRNDAARRILGGGAAPSRDGDQGAHTDWVTLRGDGSELPVDEQPVSRVLAGEQVPDFEVRLRSRAHGHEVVLAGSVHRLPAAPSSAWDRGVVAVYRDVTCERAEAAAVAATRDQLASILDALTEQAVVGFDVDGVVTFFNPGAERLTGHAATDVLGTRAGGLLDRAELAARAVELEIPVGAAVLTAVPTRQRHETRQWTIRRADGSTRQASLTVTAVRGEDGAITGFTGVAIDVTERVRAQEQLVDSEDLFRLAFDLAPVGMAMVCLTPGTVGRIRRVNRSFATFVGRAEEELLQLSAVDLFHPDDAEDHAGVMSRFLDGSLPEWRSERRFVTPSGELRWGVLSTGVVHPSDGGPPYLVCLVEDITERRAAAEAMERLALHDALTGLPNRRLLADRLEHSLAGCARSGSSVGVLYLDLDGFKAVNDSLGHAAGDDLLVVVAERLRRCVRVGDTIARLGGDEFAIVCPDIASDDDLVPVARRVLAALSEPVELSPGTALVGTSIGATTSTGDQDGEALLREADAVMYEAKRAGKGRVVFHRRASGAQEGARLLG